MKDHRRAVDGPHRERCLEARPTLVGHDTRFGGPPADPTSPSCADGAAGASRCG
jgi:hypothetical protein